MKKLIAVVPVNFGQWRNFASNENPDRGDGWHDCYFQEATFNFGWLPKNSYGKLAIEMKESNEKETDIDIALAYQKAVRDGGAGVFTRIEGSEIKLGKYEPDRRRRWEIYESDYFKMPDYDGVVLLWLMRKHNDPNGVFSVAMWTLAVFEEVPDEKSN